MRQITAVLFIMLLCGGVASFAQTRGSAALPHTLVYKTKKQYRRLVPVQLSDDRKTITSYPAPGDVLAGSADGPALPASLHGGYWLDRRGVGLNTAFLNITYEAYAKLKSAPSASELYKMIKDKHPVTELCDCGVRGKYTVAQLNELIDTKRLKTACKVMK